MVIVTVVPSLESSFNFHMMSRDATPSEILCLDEKQATNENRRKKSGGFELMTTILISRCSSRSATTTALKSSNQFFYFWFSLHVKHKCEENLVELDFNFGSLSRFPHFQTSKGIFCQEHRIKK